ncbi:MAG: sigma-54 factor interaction domain-containing protein, partial [Lentisphaeraceae bacterium]|nr:sigma-54 factor interaction domain-containing protein [Lentisphaeraceae bacterium]
MNRIIRLVEVIREVKQWRSCSKVLFSFWQGEGLNSLEVTYRGLKSFIDESGFNSCDALCKISGYIETHIIELLNGERIEYIFSWNENPSFNKEELLLLKGMLHLVASRCSTTERVTRISHSAWEKLKKTKSVPGLIAESIAMKECLHMAALVAPYDTAVLIQGESGTGKELLANYIHEHSPRRKNAFIKVNCAAIPESLIESTLFGHEQGAFTGAVNIHKGYFERAKGGTIFLDEIAELSPQVQSKLLRVLETGDFERVGSIKSLQADVRVISASHRDYDKCLATNSFRED